MLKKKALAFLQGALLLAAVTLTAIAFQPTPVQADSEEWCQMNCGGGPNFCGMYQDENGNVVRCRQDFGNCI